MGHGILPPCDRKVLETMIANSVRIQLLFKEPRR